ncbi:DNA-directed RNA polymerases II, IV and V subunit 8B isoform X2 [Daucus carota subsp. sativus]|uniref:DNA-directed RNA polymerases II, IV and V subunit 8B isoform X2 n=1 Tax=Daucus carota subsp. sativus TaxID=79200 RepID=UPI0007F03A47|nr:PREDICTED: DNA-directed RNA polymerases II, IV and V subunit 8B-like isoform X2 [Daucus carota subsp. sativus]
MVHFHFDDIIKVDRLDADGKKYDKARSEQLKMQLHLDVHSELCPVRVGDKFRIVLADTLNEDGSAVTSLLPKGKQNSLADKFEYVMHGLLYKISDEGSDANAEKVARLSFGGLQLVLKGDAAKMESFKVHEKYFLCMRKV